MVDYAGIYADTWYEEVEEAAIEGAKQLAAGTVVYKDLPGEVQQYLTEGPVAMKVTEEAKIIKVISSTPAPGQAWDMAGPSEVQGHMVGGQFFNPDDYAILLQIVAVITFLIQMRII